ncbi:fibrinogen-like protein 1 [Mytilus galloprovincialis]|uniref:fibrinogen-like protein 1 n=1 Tax=Mytilus galloprovincialis TaxID=29158 RepID=UPI003F7C66D3
MEMYEAKIKSWEDSIPTNLDKIDDAKKQTETFLESMWDILHHEQTHLNGSFHETVEQVIQKRFNGTTEFYRNWEDYENGFGDLNGEFWLGNKIIALLTSIGTHELRINLEDWDENKRYANFKNFKIDGASDKYRLHISGYSGDAGDGMTEYNGYYFSTYDRDHDTYSSVNCAADGSIKGAWWLYNCWSGQGASLNGKYTSGPSYNAGIIYKAWKYQSLKKSTMMIRRV